ncbi:unnamed protein product [Oikopleura dioica]|uniref:Uncharacterized protein n=1 Tax=Oikopleura dioica TaxID=34765 RepID=E4XGZ8_OIKDI|nr:unnamed protein product [Oikopleura dioica]
MCRTSWTGQMRL